MSEKPYRRHERYVYCDSCGTEYEKDEWPRTCVNRACELLVWRNPIPVSVALIHVGEGILGVRRNIGPGYGELALPGGFHNWGESDREAAVREVDEETGIQLPASDVSLFDTQTGHGKHQLAFFQAKTRLDALPSFDPSRHEETQELVILDGSQKLCFPTHDEMYRAALVRNEEQAKLEVEIVALEAELRLARAKAGR